MLYYYKATYQVDTSQPPPLILCLCVCDFLQLKNFKTAGSFARRLLELGPKSDIAAQVQYTMSRQIHITRYTMLAHFCVHTFMCTQE